MSNELAEALGRIRERVEKATKGPWVYPHGGAVYSHAIQESVMFGSGRDHDFQFAAHARTDIPALIEACEGLAKAVEEVLDGAAVEFSDPRVSYETWQLNPKAIEGLRAALSAAAQALTKEK